MAQRLTTSGGAAEAPRPRGRPRRQIDMEDVARAVVDLFAKGGYGAVSIPNVAEKLGVSRATLYRTVPTKEHLLGVLVEQGLSELAAEAERLFDTRGSAREQLHHMIRLHVNAAVRMRSYMSVFFFGGATLPPDVFKGWRTWSQRYEAAWVNAVERAMDAGVLRKADPVVTSRLLLGMVIWVSRWYRPGERVTAEEIAENAINLLYSSADAGPEGVGAPRRRRSPLRRQHQR